MADANRPVTLAAIAGAHGVRGEVRLKLFGEGAEALRAFSVFDAGGRKLTLKSVRPANQGAVAIFPTFKGFRKGVTGEVDATTRDSTKSKARNTTPNVPRPTSASIR